MPNFDWIGRIEDCDWDDEYKDRNLKYIRFTKASLWHKARADADEEILPAFHAWSSRQADRYALIWDTHRSGTRYLLARVDSHAASPDRTFDPREGRLARPARDDKKGS